MECGDWSPLLDLWMEHTGRACDASIQSGVILVGDQYLARVVLLGGESVLAQARDWKACATALTAVTWRHSAYAATFRACWTPKSSCSRVIDRISSSSGRRL